MSALNTSLNSKSYPEPEHLGIKDPNKKLKENGEFLYPCSKIGNEMIVGKLTTKNCLKNALSMIGIITKFKNL